MEARVRERVETLASRSLALELTAEVERLSALDDLWTAYLADPENQSELLDNLPALQSIVGEMMLLLSSVSLKSRELRQLVLEYPSDLDRELKLLFDHHPAREQLMDSRPSGPFAAAIGEACQLVEREAPSAMAELGEKLARIAADKFEAGDFKLSLKCALSLVGAGAGLVAVLAGPGALIALPPAVVMGSGVVGSVASLITIYKGWGCQRVAAPAPAPAPA